MKKFSKLATAVAVGFVLSACTTTHSPKVQEALDAAEGQFEGGYEEQSVKYKWARPEIGKIHSGPAYHRINDYTLIQRDDRKLPDIFEQHAYSFDNEDDNKQYTVDEFSALLFKAYGVVIDVSSPDLKLLNKESKDDGGPTLPIRPINQGLSADSSGQFDAVTDLIADVPSDNDRDELKLKSFTYEGDVKGMLDYVTKLNGLKWRYDDDFGKTYIYVYDTQTFPVHDFSDNLKQQSQMTTSSQQSSQGENGGSTNGSNIQSTRTKDFDMWDDVKSSVEDLISKEFGSVSFNEKHGFVTVTDSDHNLAKVKKYIDEINKASTTEILVEFKIISFQYTDGDNKSVNQNYLNNELQNNLFGAFDIEFGGGSFSPNITGNLSTLQEMVQGNFLTVATDSHKFLMGFLNQIGTAKVAFESQMKLLNNDTFSDQEQLTQEYIAEIKRDSFAQSDSGQSSISTERDVAVDGFSLSVTPKVAGDKILVSFNISQSDFISLRDAGSGANLEGVQLKTEGGKNLDHDVYLNNGIPEVVLFSHRTEETTDSQGMFDDIFWFLGGSENRNERKTAVIVTMTAYYNN
jgi:type IVB pilus formation R64 PilN family outer membrane protein